MTAPDRFRRVGVVGLGIMGTPIAGHLLDSGYDVLGYDIDPDRHVELARLGGTPSSSVAALAAEVDLVVTSLPSAAALGQVADQIARSAPAGLVVADTSTLSSAVKTEAAALLAKASVTLLDCPLSGTGVQARAADLVALMSGPVEALEGVAVVFQSFCRACHLVGPLGRGSDLKLVANLLVAVHTLAAAEALTLAEAAGIDPDVVIASLEGSAAGSTMLTVRGPAMASGGWREPNMRLDLFLKDLRLIGDFTDDVEAATPLLDVAVEMYHEAQRLGFGDNDSASVIEAVRARQRSVSRHRNQEPHQHDPN